jgi:hypothetical protein
VSIRTIEGVKHIATLRRCISGETVASSHGTRVVFDTEWEEYQVWFYIDGTRVPECDYFADSKEDAIGTASRMRVDSCPRS